MVRAASEIDFVADVETKADGSEVAFEAAARIQNAGEIIGAKIFNRADSGSDGGGAIVEKEVVEASLDGEEGMKAAMAELELGTEEAVEDANIGARDGDGWRNGGVVSETFGEDPVEVVAHFGFEHDGFVGMEAEARADAGEIGFGLREAKVIGINAGLHVIVLGEQTWGEANEERQHK